MKTLFIVSRETILALWDWVNGKKAYIVMVATITYALCGLIAGFLQPKEAVEIIFAALGLGATRHAIGKME